jgi:MinD-like ATPase involved in chromosome partitioning or flagellar assembly
MEVRMSIQQVNATVIAPPATPNGTVLLTHQEMQDFNKDYETLKTVAGSMANIALCLLVMNDEEGKDEVLVPRELIERVKGSQLVLAEDADGNVTAKITRRAPSLIAIEGRNS